MVEHLVRGSGTVRGSALLLPLHTNRLAELGFLLVDMRTVLSKELVVLVGGELELEMVSSLRPQAGVEHVVGVVLVPG